MCNYEQALAALRVISGEIGGDLGARKIEQLRRNSNRFREGLFQMGCRVLGDVDSPVIPTMLYIPHAISGFSRQVHLGEYLGEKISRR